jgi:hypothetical protein
MIRGLRANGWGRGSSEAAAIVWGLRLSCSGAGHRGQGKRARGRGDKGRGEKGGGRAGERSKDGETLTELTGDEYGLAAVAPAPSMINPSRLGGSDGQQSHHDMECCC